MKKNLKVTNINTQFSVIFQYNILLYRVIEFGQHLNFPYKCEYCLVCYNLDLNIKYVIKNLNYQQKKSKK